MTPTMKMEGPTMDRTEAAKQLSDARRSYAVAELVQERRSLGNIESSVAAHRALSVALRLMLRLHGEAVPEDFATLAARASSVALSEHLLAEDLTADLLVVDDMRRRVVAGEAEVTGAEDRRYDRAMARAADFIEAVEAYVTERFPVDPARRRRTGWYVGGLLFTLVGGVLIGRHVRPEAPIVTPRSRPPQDAEASRGAFENPGSMRPLNLPARLLLTDAHVACEGCWPIEGSVGAPYAWTSGKVELVVSGLAAVGRYAVTIGVSDSGHVNSMRFQAPGSAPSEEVHIAAGAAAAPFSFTADAEGKLHVVLLFAAWKPSEQVPGSTDTRELGVAIGDVRIEEAAERTRRAP
jgi:hypothetical protein